MKNLDKKLVKEFSDLLEKGEYKKIGRLLKEVENSDRKEEDKAKILGQVALDFLMSFKCPHCGQNFCFSNCEKC